MDKYRALSEYFGYSEFRKGQEELVDALLSGRDAMGIMPTGGGKSICYQLPALLKSGTAIVISPLISLMKDQVMALKNSGVSAAFINSSLSSDEIREVYANMANNGYKIVYVAPERLETGTFESIVGNIDISLVAVDEAHCISQWGQDFRPSYLRIPEFLHKLPKRPPIAAFTATATEQVRLDIERTLELRDPIRVTTGFDRPNLFFEVRKPKNKLYELLEILEKYPDKSGIIYCSTRRDTEKVCDELQERDISATRYHAGLSDHERVRNQEDFIYDRKRIMVATNAFGMGIDKSNISFVIHYNMPKSLEAYYQEAGRAGRDGEKADCILLFSAGDIETARFLIRQSENEELSPEKHMEIMRQDMARLESMVGYCRYTGCLRGYILNYFGEEHDEKCMNCGNCLTKFTNKDITTEAQMILSCVKRAEDKLGYNVGASTIADTLHGSKGKRILELGLDKISTYGLMREKKKTTITELIEYLKSEGYVQKDPMYGGLFLTKKSREVLFENKKVKMKVKSATKDNNKTEKPIPAKTLSNEDEDLINALKALRMNIARKSKVPAYIICSNATLTDMASKKPQNITQLLTVSGIGEAKAEKYGNMFISVIKEYM